MLHDTHDDILDQNNLLDLFTSTTHAEEVSNILLETDYYMLLEDGSYILLES